MADIDKLSQHAGVSSQGLLGGQAPLQGPPGAYGTIGGPSMAGGNKFGDSSLVYMPGKAFKAGTYGDDWQGRGTSQGRNMIKASEARQEPLRWAQSDPETLKKFVNSGVLNKVPGFDVGMGMPEIMQAWDKLMEDAWMMNKYMPGGEDKKLTPWDVLNSYGNGAGRFGTVKRGDWLYDIATGEKVKYVGPKTKTQTDKRVDLSSVEDVRAITTNALAELLGRAPTAEELGRFRATINSLEEANPVLATTTQTLDDMGEVVSTSTRQEGGVSAEARALAVSDDAKATPEYAKFQSGSTIYGWLAEALGMRG